MRSETGIHTALSVAIFHVQVQIVRTYDLVPQALLSADSHHLVASEVAMTEQGSHSSTRSMARTSAPKRPSTTLSAVPPRAYPDQAEESCSEVSYNTRTSTDIESYCGRPNAAASSMSASDSGVAGWYARFFPGSYVYIGRPLCTSIMMCIWCTSVYESC